MGYYTTDESKYLRQPFFWLKCPDTRIGGEVGYRQRLSDPRRQKRFKVPLPLFHGCYHNNQIPLGGPLLT